VPTINKVIPKIPELPLKKKVAAYCRVSVETDRTLNSLSAQVSYYSNLIQTNPAWEYAGVYADSGISGTGTTKRIEFQRLIKDCEAGLIDIVLTKSVSRFARNTVDLLETVRHLKNIGVEVRFEEQGINSLSGDGELMLTILASFAQEEIRSQSEAVKWGTRKRFADGIPNGKFRVYGYTWDGDQLVIVPEEAAIVRRIYDNFLAGKSRLETERELYADGIRTRSGCVMRDSNLKSILTNVTYTGNLLFQKYYVKDPFTQLAKKNNGELPQYYVPDNHEPIIDQATFDFVQAEMARRRELGPRGNKSLNITCFTQKIWCADCERYFVRSTRKNTAKDSQLGDKLTSWVCGATKRKGGRCPGTGHIPERILKPLCAEVLGIEEFDDGVFTSRVEQIVIPKHKVLEFHLTDGTIITRHWVNTSKQDCWTPERRAAQSQMTRGRKMNLSDEELRNRSERLQRYWEQRRAEEAATNE